MVFWIIVGVVFWLFFCLCCARYEQTLQNALKNWREELPLVQERCRQTVATAVAVIGQ